MAQPTPYTRQSDFSDLEANDPPPSDLDGIGTELDSEFDALKTTLDQTLDNLALIQRDDGALANGIVTSASLAPGLSVGVNPAEAWVTATAYAVNDLVWQNGILYICLVAHTSGTFATDLAAAKWSIVIDLSAEVPAVAGLLIGTVEQKTTNYSVVQADNGKAFLVDTTSGTVTVTLPQISSLTNGNFFRVLIFKKVAANTMTLARAGSDTINGATLQSFTIQYSAALVFSRTGDADWKLMDLSPPAAASTTAGNAANITFFKMT